MNKIEVPDNAIKIKKRRQYNTCDVEQKVSYVHLRV